MALWVLVTHKRTIDHYCKDSCDTWTVWDDPKQKQAMTSHASVCTELAQCVSAGHTNLHLPHSLCAPAAETLLRVLELQHCCQADLFLLSTLC